MATKKTQKKVKKTVVKKKAKAKGPQKKQAKQKAICDCSKGIDDIKGLLTELAKSVILLNNTIADLLRTVNSEIEKDEQNLVDGTSSVGTCNQDTKEEEVDWATTTPLFPEQNDVIDEVPKEERQ